MRTSRSGALVEPDPADAGELDRPGDNGAGSVDDLAGRDPGGQAELARRQHCLDRVVVRGSVGAEDGDHPLGPEALEHTAVPVEHVSHRGERLVEQPAVLLGVVGAARRRGENGHEPQLGGFSRRRRVRDRWRSELGILAQHAPLELLQLRRGVEAELVGEREPGGPVDLERLGLAAAAVQRKHQLAAQPLAQRMEGDELLQLADDRSVPAERELCVDPLFLGSDAQLVETRRLEPGEFLLLEVGERRAAPEVERLAQQPRRRGGLRRSRLLQEPLEAVAVDRVATDREPVAGRVSDEHVAADQLAQRRDGVLERPGCGGGRALTPEVRDEPVGRHDLARPQRQCRQERTLLPARQRDDPVAVQGLERAEQADLHRSGCNTGNKRFQVSGG